MLQPKLQEKARDHCSRLWMVRAVEGSGQTQVSFDENEFHSDDGLQWKPQRSTVTSSKRHDPSPS